MRGHARTRFVPTSFPLAQAVGEANPGTRRSARDLAAGSQASVDTIMSIARPDPAAGSPETL
jgi:hypothetical protein